MEKLLELFYEAIDPTTINRQGGDIGTQYRTGIYYEEERDKEIIEESLENLQKRYKRPIVIEINKCINFYKAEEYHQKYLDKNPGGYCHIGEDKFRKARLSNVDLSDIQYRVTQKGETEPPFQNEYYDFFEPGLYVDIVSGEPLFLSTKNSIQDAGGPAFQIL